RKAVSGMDETGPHPRRPQSRAGALTGTPAPLTERTAPTATAPARLPPRSGQTSAHPRPPASTARATATAPCPATAASPSPGAMDPPPSRALPLAPVLTPAVPLLLHVSTGSILRKSAA